MLPRAERERESLVNGGDVSVLSPPGLSANLCIADLWTVAHTLGRWSSGSSPGTLGARTF